ncbi:MAG: hypothetical protein QOC64_1323 [Solirubrobacteraceae bacterium]|jgi:hypothetical protein|nr:hypothetical protein [Solirubrobacteraceae bacterium]
MTRVCCQACRLRFGSASAAFHETCPRCGEPLEPVATAEQVLGFRLFNIVDALPALPMAAEAALPVDPPRLDRD